MLIRNRIPTSNPAEGVLLGIVHAQGTDPAHYPEDFDEALRKAIASASGSDEALEARRQSARDMLRNGAYKPTGRGKPASEYLVRAATEDSFPRINALVDVNNLLSLQERLPISLWDLDRIGDDEMGFRLGGEDENYVFNQTGQVLELRDLVVGCSLAARSGPDGEPVISPIKDSQIAKTTDGTERVAACVYAPVNTVSESILELICVRFAQWLQGCGRRVHVRHAVVAPGGEVEL